MKKNKIITEMCQKDLAFKTDGGNITTIVEIPLDNTTKKFAINNKNKKSSEKGVFSISGINEIIESV